MRAPRCSVARRVFTSHQVDLSIADAAAEAIAAVSRRCRAGRLVPNRRRHQQSGQCLDALVAEGGLSATAVLQAPLSIEVARAVKAVRPQAHFINCCFPDVVNPLIAALDLPISCGVGNVAILSNAFAGALGAGARSAQGAGALSKLAPWRQPAERAPAGPRACGSTIERSRTSMRALRAFSSPASRRSRFPARAVCR